MGSTSSNNPHDLSLWLTRYKRADRFSDTGMKITDDGGMTLPKAGFEKTKPGKLTPAAEVPSPHPAEQLKAIVAKTSLRH